MPDFDVALGEPNALPDDDYFGRLMKLVEKRLGHRVLAMICMSEAGDVMVTMPAASVPLMRDLVPVVTENLAQLLDPEFYA